MKLNPLAAVHFRFISTFPRACVMTRERSLRMITSDEQISPPSLLCKENRPFPSSKNPHFQNEARCTTFLVKMSFNCMRMKNDFHIKGWAPTLVVKQRPWKTRQWPILCICTLCAWIFFSNLLPRENICAKRRNFTISKPVLVVKFACLT